MFMKKIIPVLALALMMGCAAKPALQQEEDIIEEPSGTIVGNPAPKPGTLKILSPGGKLLYIINLYENGAVDVSSLDDQGQVKEVVQGTLTEITSPQSLTISGDVSEGGHRFELNVTFSDGSSLALVIETNADQTITAIAIEVNGLAVEVTVEITDTSGNTRTIVIELTDSALSRACLPDDPRRIVAAAEEAYNNGQTALAQGLIGEARARYEEAVRLDPNHAEAQFGAAITDLMLIPQTASGLEIQDGLGQERFTIDDLFGPGSYLEARNSSVRDSGPRPSLTRFPWTTLDGSFHIGELLALARDGYRAEDLQGDLAGMRVSVDEIIDHLDSARECNGFQFTVPGSLFYSRTSVEINYTDLTFLIASQYAHQAGLYFMTTWRFDVDLGRLFNERGIGEMPQAELLTTMNQFFRIRSLEDLSSGREYFLQTAVLLLEGFNNMPAAPVFGTLDSNAETEAGLAELTELAEAFSDSFGGMTLIPGVSPVASINLSALFDNPPDLAEIGIDPFVIEDGEIILVEAFFQEMLNRFMVGLDLSSNDQRIAVRDLMTFPFAAALLDEVWNMRAAEGI